MKSHSFVDIGKALDAKLGGRTYEDLTGIQKKLYKTKTIEELRAMLGDYAYI